MNNRNIPQYLGQQNVVRRVVSRMPAIPVAMGVPVMPQPVVQPVVQPGLIQQPQSMRPRAVRVSPLPQVYPQPVVQQRYSTAAPRYQTGFSTLSVTQPDSEYLQYSDQFTRDYEFNQSQQLMQFDSGYGGAYEYQEQSSSVQDFSHAPAPIRYTAPVQYGQRQLQVQPQMQPQPQLQIQPQIQPQLQQQVQYYEQDLLDEQQQQQQRFPAITAPPASASGYIPASSAPALPPPVSMSIPASTPAIVTPAPAPPAIVSSTPAVVPPRAPSPAQPIQLIIDSSQFAQLTKGESLNISNISNMAQGTSTPKPEVKNGTGDMEVVVEPDKSVDNEVIVTDDPNVDVDNDVMDIAANLHLDSDDDADDFLDTSFITNSNSKSSTSKSGLTDEDVVSLPIEYLKPEDQVRGKRVLQRQRQARYLENLIKKKGSR